MFRSAFLAAVVALSIVVQECNVGDILDLLVTYQVSVHNASSRTGYLTLDMVDWNPKSPDGWTGWSRMIRAARSWWT